MLVTDTLRWLTGAVSGLVPGNTAVAAAINSRRLAQYALEGGRRELKVPGSYYFDTALVLIADTSWYLGPGVELRPTAAVVTNCIIASDVDSVELVGPGKIVCTAATVPSFTNVDGLEVSVRIEDASGNSLAASISGCVQTGVFAVNALGRVFDATFNRRRLGLPLYERHADYGTTLIAPPVSGITTAVGASCVINSSAATTIAGETVWQVSATASSSSNNWFEIVLPQASQAFSASDLSIEIVPTDLSKINLITPYVGNSGYTVFANYSITSQITPQTTSPYAINGLTSYFVTENLWTKSGFSDAVGNQAFVNCKIRFYVVNGETAVVALRAVRAAATKSKARLAIVFDDGYDSTVKVGIPILAEYGLKSTISVIYSEVGGSGNISLTDLQSYVAAGNECIPHGPNHPSTGGAGNLFTAWSTNAERIADVTACRDYLLTNGLCTEYGARSYVWPQGTFAESTSDLSFLGLMLDNGFTVGRAAQTPTVFYTHKTNAWSRNNLASLTLPIIGHTFTSAGAETANINSIKTRIANAAISRADCTLMLHRVVGVDAASISTEISSNRLRELCEAIRSEVDAGMMDVVLFSEFAK